MGDEMADEFEDDDAGRALVAFACTSAAVAWGLPPAPLVQRVYGPFAVVSFSHAGVCVLDEGRATVLARAAELTDRVSGVTIRGWLVMDGLGEERFSDVAVHPLGAGQDAEELRARLLSLRDEPRDGR